MNLPNSIPHSINCPNCINNWDVSKLKYVEKIANLEWQKERGDYYLVYYCSSCKNGWTTNESDELSYKHKLSVERSIVRKNKINKLNEL